MNCPPHSLLAIAPCHWMEKTLAFCSHRGMWHSPYFLNLSLQTAVYPWIPQQISDCDLSPSWLPTKCHLIWSTPIRWHDKSWKHRRWSFPNTSLFLLLLRSQIFSWWIPTSKKLFIIWHFQNFNTNNHNFLLNIRSKLFHLSRYRFWFGNSLAISWLLIIPIYFSFILSLYISL